MSAWLPSGYDGAPSGYVPPLGALPGDDEPAEPEYAECCQDRCDACGEPACVDCEASPAIRCEHGHLVHDDRYCLSYCGDCGREDG